MDQARAAEVKLEPSERDRMLADYYARELRRRVELARVRSPAGLARLFPGLRRRK